MGDLSMWVIYLHLSTKQERLWTKYTVYISQEFSMRETYDPWAQKDIKICKCEK